MYVRHTSRKIPFLISAIAVTFIALLYNFYATKLATTALSTASANRYHSYLLADELRQSSDDLTRLGRTYVVTADPEYERQYMRILDIRNGKAPRPKAYHRIYWDFVAAGTQKPRPDGPTIALQELMKEAGFTEGEFAKLKEAQANSDGLVNLEVKAMNAVKGKFADPSGNYSLSGPPDLELARNLVHSPEYHQYKAQIMRPLDDFFELLENRTDAEVARATERLTEAQNLFIAALIALIGEFILLIYFGRQRLAAQLGTSPDELERALVEIAGGNLAVNLPEAPPGSALSYVRQMNEQLKSLIGEALKTSERLRTAVDQVASVIENTAGRASRQQDMTDLVATAVNEMGSTVQEIAHNASSAAQASQSAHAEAQQARQVVGDSSRHIESMAGEIGSAAQAVGKLAEEVSSIDQVLAVIRGISEQTNLLALNAAIEAARAGEMGRGFAVVADEVRTLAGRTQSSTDEIQLMIQRLKQGAETAVNAMHAGQAATGTGVGASQLTGKSLDTISAQIENISDLNRQVATATEQQSSMTEEINRNVQGIADLAHATAGEIHSCRENCRTLRQLADALSKQMSSFRL